jgi:hypothetical protein
MKETQTGQTTEHIDITDMEANKRRSVLISGMNRNGFTGVIKQIQNNQTYYVFIYKNTF